MKLYCGLFDNEDLLCAETNYMFCVPLKLSLKLSAGCLEHIKNKISRKSNPKREKIEGGKPILVVRGPVIQNELRSSTLCSFQCLSLIK